MKQYLLTSMYSASNEKETLLLKALDKFEQAEKLNDNFFKANFEKAKVYVERGMLMLGINITDNIAYALWYFNLASAEFSKAFKKNPDCFNKILTFSEKIYKSSKLFKTSTNIKYKLVLLLKSFYLLFCAFKESPVTPTASNYFQAGAYLFEYLRCGGKNEGHFQFFHFHFFLFFFFFPSYYFRYFGINFIISNLGLHLAGATGSMFESAFLIKPSIGIADFVYTIQKRNNQYNIGINENIQSVDIYKKILPKIEGEDIVCEYNESISIQINDTQLHFTPLILHNPEGNYRYILFISRIFHILGQNKNSSSSFATNSLNSSTPSTATLSASAASLSINSSASTVNNTMTSASTSQLSGNANASYLKMMKSYQIFQLHFDEFILSNSASNTFILTKFDICLPLNDENNLKLHLIASDTPIENINIENFNNSSAFIISSVLLKPGENTFTVHQTRPGEVPFYLFSQFHPPMSSKTKDFLFNFSAVFLLIFADNFVFLLRDGPTNLRRKQLVI